MPKKIFLRLKKNEKILPKDFLQECQQVEVFELTGESLEEIPAELFTLPQLQILKIKNGKLKSLPQLSQGQPLSPLKTLQLSHQQLANLPEWLFEFKSLELLDLSSNCLKTLPESLAKLSILKRLNLDGNQFQTFPGALYGLKGLNHLSVDENPLTESEKGLLHQRFSMWF
ncbi:MAG: hypothetical protein WCG27_00915 [Pseudomonadota bacterium]